MRAPLEHEANIPESKESEGNGHGDNRSFARAKKLCEMIEQNSEAENEGRGERNEKPIAVRGNAGPIRVTSDKNVKREEGAKQRSADTRRTAPQQKEAKDGEKENGCPCEQPMIGREKHTEENW